MLRDTFDSNYLNPSGLGLPFFPRADTRLRFKAAGKGTAFYLLCSAGLKVRSDFIAAAREAEIQKSTLDL